MRPTAGGATMPRLARFLCCGLVLAACKPTDKGPPASQDSATPAPPPAPTATRVSAVPGFSSPESVLHDSAQDVYFVSNINGSATAKDGNGFISRVTPEGAVVNLRFIEGGKNGVVLNAPKGMALAGDTLWVADIDAVRAFDARTGAPLDSVSLSTLAAVFLNDITATRSGGGSSSSSSVANRCSPGSPRIAPPASSRPARAGSTASWWPGTGFSCPARPIPRSRATKPARSSGSSAACPAPPTSAMTANGTGC